MIEPAHTFIIAEAGVNHNGNVGIAKNLIEAAAEARADAIKFQSFHAENLVSAHAKKARYQLASTGAGESQLEMLSRLELDRDAHIELFAYCQEKRIVFLSTPFDTGSVDLLEELGVPIFKIASGEITNIPFIRYIAKKQKPIILSTGMCRLDEVGEALQAIQGEGNHNVTLLHCVSEYPAPIEQVNLRAMITMREAFMTPVGYSDHTLGAEVALAAVTLGASVIEKHFTLNRNMNGPDHRASLERIELKQLVHQIRNIEIALGDGIKRPAPCEIMNQSVVRRSLFAAVEIASETVITEEMIEALRPGMGISPAALGSVLGRVAKRDIAKGQMLEWDALL